MSDAAILMEIVLRSFVESDDFNGILLENAGELAGLSGDDLRLVTKALIDQAQVELSFEHHTGNPHIKRLPGLPPTEQIRAVLEDDLRGICIYPSAAKISKHTDITLYDDRPYSKRLLLAEAQLIPVFFDLCVLERYMEDPRYSYDFLRFWRPHIDRGAGKYSADTGPDLDRKFWNWLRPEPAPSCRGVPSIPPQAYC